MMLTSDDLVRMQCVVLASVEDTRTDDGSHNSNSSRCVEATGVSGTACNTAIFSNKRVFL